MTILLLSLLACDSEPPAPEVAPITPDEIAAAAASTLCEAAAGIDRACEATGGAATIGGATIAISAEVGHFLALPSNTIGMGASAQQLPGEVQVGATLSISVDGAPLATAALDNAGSDVDADAARAAALDGLIQRWAVSQGVAILDALGGELSPALGSLGMHLTPVAVADRQAWPGYPVVSGVGFDPAIASKMTPNVGSMIAALGPYLEGLSSSGLHAVQITAELGGGGAPGPCGILPTTIAMGGEATKIVPLAGEVRVDGAPVGDICALSETVNWPLPRDGAKLIWEQFVIVGPEGAGAGAGESEEAG